ncbi:hypothetical protein [[Mycoplasma] anseris]|uniref:Lipoprotein n=1 Tax=[Mycoplasma] anseris TaxID=92400 RepID=A0A2Z4ND68_9BACT|nr:hypothetical protein [[Mycoplasma] anseris]AWX69522.1 hypothetical protein DP065_02025 [[Mycoplasma] anseris]
MKKRLINRIILGNTFLIPLVSFFSISCNSKRPKYDERIINSKEIENASYDNANIIIDKSKFKIEGSWNNSYNISKTEIQKIFQKYNMVLTEEGKKITAKQFYDIAYAEIVKRILPSGIYFVEGKESFEAIFSSNPIKKYLNITWPNFAKFDQNYFEVRYRLEVYNPTTPDEITIRAQFFHSDKFHIDNRYPNIVIQKHDTGISVGPKWYFTIKGFKASE